MGLWLSLGSEWGAHLRQALHLRRDLDAAGHPEVVRVRVRRRRLAAPRLLSIPIPVRRQRRPHGLHHRDVQPLRGGKRVGHQREQRAHGAQSLSGSSSGRPAGAGHLAARARAQCSGQCGGRAASGGRTCLPPTNSCGFHAGCRLSSAAPPWRVRDSKPRVRNKSAILAVLTTSRGGV